VGKKEEVMKRIAGMLVVAVVGAWCAAAPADVFHDYENFDEGDLGATVVHGGVTYRDVNTVGGVFPDGSTFVPGDLGSGLIVEDAGLFYLDFPSYGSPVNALTFGMAFIPGPNLTIGPLASTWMDLDEMSNAVSLDLAYYENGPWGGIEYVLEALAGGSVVATDSFMISDLGGRDNPTFSTMSISGAQFDQLHLYARLGDEFSAPRGMIDNLSITAVPEPVSFVLLAVGGVLACHRRR
jgi:hypothetical protein